MSERVSVAPEPERCDALGPAPSSSSAGSGGGQDVGEDAADAVRRARLARDVLHDRDGTFADQRDSPLSFACASGVLDQTAKPAAEGRSPSGEFPTKWVVSLPQEGAAPGETIGAIESLIIGQSSGAGGLQMRVACECPDGT
jgi:hypothetical protein